MRKHIKYLVRTKKIYRILTKQIVAPQIGVSQSNQAGLNAHINTTCVLGYLVDIHNSNSDNNALYMKDLH